MVRNWQFFCEGESTPQFTNMPSFPVVLTFLKYLKWFLQAVGVVMPYFWGQEK